MAAFEPTDHPHRRYNPMKDEWVLVCPHRCKRPWQGQTEDVQEEERPEFDPKNPLCPGVTRSNGQKNPEYTSTYVFANDFPALLEEVPDPDQQQDDLFKIKGAGGDVRVVYSPLDAVHIARENPDKQVVFLAIGFETTAPANAMSCGPVSAPPAEKVVVAPPEGVVTVTRARPFCTV